MYINDDFMTRSDDRFETPVIPNDGCCQGECDVKGHGYGSDTSNARWGLREKPVAMVYAPLQEWRSIYDAEMGLCRGTIFAELDLPFVGCKGCGGGRYVR